MKAIRFHEHGGPEVLKHEDIPEPEPGPGDCLVKIMATTLNGADVMTVEGIPGLTIPLPMIPGIDTAGEIAALGHGVDGSKWAVGDRVSVYGIIPVGEAFRLMGETLPGACCDYITVAQTNLLPIPDNVSYVHAAALPVAYGTALRMMVKRARVQAGEKVLILGATGGVGTCCVQLAKMAGAEVLACGSSEWKVERLKELGADHVVNVSKQDFLEESRRIFGRPRVTVGDKVKGTGGADIVVNYTGGDTLEPSQKALSSHGRMAVCGATAGYQATVDLRYIWSFEQQIIGSNGWDIEDQAELLDMVSEGRLDPIIHAERPLKEYPQALQELIDREVFGKSAVLPSHD
ncbi:MAG: zinc-binding dehydrogenase [Rhodospirillales bacterium]|jgi:alcohol dehydrogenase|nr:zinc-binding dehydrogenase [Rhodospirillales bacterium]